MAEIEVGEYVRTNKGLITKITDIEIEKYEDGTSEIFIETELNHGYLDYTIEDIVKHSKQLIDLIEVGDIVNSCIVIGFGYECVNGNKEKSILVEGKYTKVNYALLNWDIETILTKEQMEANCYKVGGEDGN